MDEFFTQGDAERALGLPISMNCDREKVLPSKVQMGFVGYLVQPAWSALVAYAPELKPCADRLEAHLARYRQGQQQGEQAFGRYDPIRIEPSFTCSRRSSSKPSSAALPSAAPGVAAPARTVFVAAGVEDVHVHVL